MKALRRACVSHFMGQPYNDFLAEVKDKYQTGDNSDLWEMVRNWLPVARRLPEVVVRTCFFSTNIRRVRLAAARIWDASRS